MTDDDLRRLGRQESPPDLPRNFTEQVLKAADAARQTDRSQQRVNGVVLAWRPGVRDVWTYLLLTALLALAAQGYFSLSQPAHDELHSLDPLSMSSLMTL